MVLHTMFIEVLPIASARKQGRPIEFKEDWEVMKGQLEVGEGVAAESSLGHVFEGKAFILHHTLHGWLLAQRDLATWTFYAIPGDLADKAGG